MGVLTVCCMTTKCPHHQSWRQVMKWLLYSFEMLIQDALLQSICSVLYCLIPGPSSFGGTFHMRKLWLHEWTPRHSEHARRGSMPTLWKLFASMGAAIKVVVGMVQFRQTLFSFEQLPIANQTWSCDQAMCIAPFLFPCRNLFLAWPNSLPVYGDQHVMVWTGSVTLFCQSWTLETGCILRIWVLTPSLHTLLSTASPSLSLIIMSENLIGRFSQLGFEWGSWGIQGGNG